MKITYKLKHPDKPESSLYTQFRVNGERFKFYLGKNVQTKYWSTSKQMVLSGHKHAQEINNYLKTYREDLDKIIAVQANNKIRLDKNKIQLELDKLYKVDSIKVSDGEMKDFISFMDHYINSKNGKARTTTQILKQNRKFVISAFELISKKDIAAYDKMSSKNKAKTDLKPTKLLDFDSINIDFLEKFQNYMFNAKFKTTENGKDVFKHYKKNYIGKQIKKLKQFVDAAIEKGYVKFFKYNSIKAISEDVDSVYTDVNELQEFLKLKLDKASLEEITRDKYVCNCFLGLRYSDLSKIKKHFFSEQKIEGINYVIYKGRAKKTDRKSEFVLHPTAVEILKKYKFEFPTISEANYNELLKKIACKAGLVGLEHIRETRGNEKIYKDVPKYALISSHTGRRSFCTNMYIAGVPIQGIMGISGHKTESEFMRYINKEATVNIKLVAQQVSSIKPLSLY